MRIKILCMLLMAIITVFGCQREKSVSKVMIPVPPLEIKVDLDKKAEREMRERSETIHISLTLYGNPRKDSGIKEGEINKAIGLVLGYFEKEMNEEGVVRFEGLRIPERLYKALEDKNYDVSFGIRSGWKSSKFDLLDCEYFDKSISEVSKKQHTIKCKLNQDPNVKWTGLSYNIPMEEMVKYTKAYKFEGFIRQVEPLVIETFGNYSKPAVLLIEFNCNPNGCTVDIKSQDTTSKKLLLELRDKLSKLPKLETTGTVSFQLYYEITP